MRSAPCIWAWLAALSLGCQTVGDLERAKVGVGPGSIEFTFAVPEKGPTGATTDAGTVGERWNSTYWTLDQPGIPQTEPLQVKLDEANYRFGATSSGQSNQTWRHVGFADGYIAGTYKSDSNKLGIGVYFLEYKLEGGDEWYSGYYIGLTEKEQVEICPFLMSNALTPNELIRKLRQRSPNGGCREFKELAELLGGDPTE